MICFPPLGFGDHSCQLACLLVGMSVHSDWSLFGLLETDTRFVELAHASEAVASCYTGKQHGLLFCWMLWLTLGSSGEVEQGTCLAWLTQALCSMGAFFSWSCQFGVFCEHKILFKNPKQTKKIPLGLRQNQIAEINYPELDKHKHFLK